MPRRFLWIWCFTVCLCVSSVPARAGGFMITMNNPTIPRGGMGTLDVLLASNASPSSPDLLNNFTFTLQITGPIELQFSPSQSFGYLTNSQYIFAGDSTNAATGSAGTVSTTVYKNDTFVGNDSTASGNPVSLSSANTPVLLAALTLDATITNPGDSYTISLIPPSGDGSMNSSLQTFFDVYNSDTGGETSAVPFTNMLPGTVTISAATVPEPGSMALALTVILISVGVVGVRRLRRSEPV